MYWPPVNPVNQYVISLPLPCRVKNNKHTHAHIKLKNCACAVDAAGAPKSQKANPANLQIRLSSFFILKLAFCSLQDVDGGLADMNSQGWKKHGKQNDEFRPQPLLFSSVVLKFRNDSYSIGNVNVCVCVWHVCMSLSARDISYVGLWTPCGKQY